jgi:acyl dehydratase
LIKKRIDKFADATMDHQFIHVDPEQAEPIFGSTIAHGFLSLISCRWYLFRARNWYGA